MPRFTVGIFTFLPLHFLHAMKTSILMWVPGLFWLFLVNEDYEYKSKFWAIHCIYSAIQIIGASFLL